MKWSIMILVVIGLVGAFCVAMLATSLRPPPTVTPAVLAAPEPPREEGIVVAAAALSPMTVVQPGSVIVKTVPAASVPQGAATQPAAVIGRVLVAPVREGQPVTKFCLASQGSGLYLSSVLPHNKRAMTLSLDDYAGMDGLLHPGCLVDVLVSLKMGPNNQQAVSTTLLKSIEVLAVGDRTVLSGADEQPAKTASAVHASKLFVTLVVDPKQAQALALALENGKLSLVMRNPSDQQNPNNEPTLLTQLSSDYAAFIKELTKPPTPPPPKIIYRTATAPAPKVTPPEPPKPKPWETTVIKGNKADIVQFPPPPAK